MSDQSAAADRLAASSSDHDLQRWAVRNTDVALDVLVGNPDLGVHAVRYAVERFNLDANIRPWSSSVFSDARSEALRAALIDEATPAGCALLCGYRWVPDDAVAGLMGRCAPERVPDAVSNALSRNRGAMTLGQLPTELIEPTAAALSRWYDNGDTDQWKGIIGALLDAGDHIRAAGLPWFEAPPANLDADGLARWAAVAGFTTSAAGVVAYADALVHPSCHPALAAKALTELAQIADDVFNLPSEFRVAAAGRHIAAHPELGPGTVAEWAGTEADVLDAESAVALAELLDLGAVARLLVLLAGRSVGNADANAGFVAVMCARPDALGAVPVDAVLHYVDRSFRRATPTVLAYLERRCGARLGAAISLLGGGFAGTFDELVAVTETAS